MAKTSFKNGYNLVPGGQQKRCRELLREVFNVNTDVSVYNRINGKPAPNTIEVEAIEGVLSSLGVAKSKIWD